ncbi:hypothetical protein DFH06DRAFT_604361 [Mycena polygramma]|nr:hypothetical protein DFH06DRAFT_604361 [Mycena polygramma]
MAQNTTPVSAPVSAPNSNPWAPSMPNSDLFTLKSAKDAARFMSSKERGTGLIPRRVVAVRTCPLVMYQSAAPASMAPAVSSSAPASQPPAAVQSGTISLQGTRGRAAIGLGHPSSSKRSTAPVQSAAPAAPTEKPPAPRARINSSTIKRRTERFPRRELHTIAEDADCTQPSTSRPVCGTRKRSYAQAVTETETDETPKNRTGRRITPTPAPTSPTSTPTIPGSPRCAAKQHPSGAFVSSIVALASRSTSSAAPQAGPTQVQSPRLLFPALMAGSPCSERAEMRQKARVARRFTAHSTNPTNVTVAASPFKILFLFPCCLPGPWTVPLCSSRTFSYGIVFFARNPADNKLQKWCNDSSTCMCEDEEPYNFGCELQFANSGRTVTWDTGQTHGYAMGQRDNP